MGYFLNLFFRDLIKNLLNLTVFFSLTFGETIHQVPNILVNAL